MQGTGAILLAGGRSSRMGKDKAALVIRGRSLSENLLMQLNRLVKQTVVMLSAQQPLPPGLPIDGMVTIGRDRIPDQGPLNGIADALPLLAPEIDPIFVLSCDLPYLTAVWLEVLQTALTPQADAVVTHFDGVINPLIALYRRKVLQQAPRILAGGRGSCMALLTGYRVVSVSPETGSRQTKDVNTPSEFQAAKTYLENRPFPD